MDALQPVLLSTEPAIDLLSATEPPVRPLRVCLLGYRSDPFSGGQGVYLRFLSRALADLGHRVDVLSGQPYPVLDERVRLIKLPGMNLYENGLRSLRPRHLRSRADMLEWFSKLSGGFAEPQAFGMRAVEYLRRHRDDYDLVHDNQSLSYGMLELQDMGIPLVSTIHHPITSDLRLALRGGKHWWHRLLIRRWHAFIRMQRQVAHQLRHVVTVSSCSRDDIVNDFDLDPARIAVVHNGVDTDVFAPRPDIVRQPLRLMTTASSDQPLKGLRYLLQALHDLAGTYPELRLLVIGKLSRSSTTGALIRRLRLSDRVEFRSGISTQELVTLYAEATLAVVPSLYEGFGLPAAEAMACGVPLVSSDGGALPEIVGDAASRVPAGNRAALAAAIAGLLDNPQRRDELGRRGRQRMLKEFCWKKTAQDMTAYYETVLADYADH